MKETHWLPGLFVLAVAFAAAGIYLLLARRGPAQGPSAGPSPDTEQRALELRAQTLLDALRELRQSRHQMAEADWRAEVDRLEREAAAALRARDEGRARPPAGAPTPPGAAPTGHPAAPAVTFFDRNPQLKGAVWGAGVVLFFVALGLVLSQEARPREEGGTLTGRTPPTGAPQAAGRPAGRPRSPELTSALEQLRANPGDLDAASLASHELIQRGDFEEGQKLVDRGLAVDPFHTELRVHRAVLRALRQEVDGAREELLQLVELYPDAQEALLFLAGMELQAGNSEAALGHLERFLVEVPRTMHPPQLAKAVADLRRTVRGADVPPPAPGR